MVFLCMKIFFARIIDVSLGTFRTLTTVKGKNGIASFIGFVEVLVWFLIVKEALNTDINSIWIGISYALGFASGTYIGGLVSDILIKSTMTIFIITNKPDDMIKNIRNNGFALTALEIKNNHHKDIKNMLFIETDKRNLKKLEDIVKSNDKRAFFVASESHYVANGYFGPNVK